MIVIFIEGAKSILYVQVLSDRGYFFKLQFTP